MPNPAQRNLLSGLSRKGNRWDNVVAESFFATLQFELAHLSYWRTRTQSRSEVLEYIELLYNRQPRLSARGYLCPNEFSNFDIVVLIYAVSCFRSVLASLRSGVSKPSVNHS